MPSESDAPAVSVQGVSLQYRALLERKPTLKGRIARLGRKGRVVRTVDAVRDVSFDVARGSFTGIVGANGAGKSTLIRVIAGILPPTKGRVVVRGRITTLLASGVGFNSELSGRENILMGGLVAGLTPREMEGKLDEIIEFADLGEFIDFPIKTYSSGMRGRLGFSVSVHLDPDILLVDEGLSTGDAAFKDKATAKMQELLKRAGAIILVSHGLKTIIDQGDNCIWLHKGQMLAQGDPQEVVDKYTAWVKVKQNASTLEDV